MINTSKGWDGVPDENKLSVEEMLHKIMDRTGITREQAQEALDKNNNDLLDAMIYAERTYGVSSGKAQQQQPHFSVDEGKTSGENFDFNKVIFTAGKFLSANTLDISHNGSRIGSIPLFVCVLALLASFSTVLVAIIIAMFFNVSFSLKGRSTDFSKANSVIASVYDFVQSIKKMFA